MKTLIFVTIFLLISLSSFPETIPTETEKISTFCKLWGFLKYYHPEVAKGNLDWDSEFMNGVKSINNLKTKQELNNYYSEWIKSLGEVKHCKKCNNILPDSLKFNLELNWLSDTSVFSNNMIEQLQYTYQFSIFLFDRTGKWKITPFFSNTGILHYLFFVTGISEIICHLPSEFNM